MNALPGHLLTVVVPFINLTPQMRYWVPEALKAGVSVLLVHDQADLNIDEDSCLEADEQIRQLVDQGAQLLEGKFGDPGSARNFGIESVRSAWVTFWDSDDLPVLNNVVNAIKELGDSEFDYLIGDFAIIRNCLSDKSFSQLVRDQSLLNVAMHPGVWRFFFKTKTLTGVRFPHSTMGEDQVFLARYGLQSRKGKFLECQTYEYFAGNNGSLTSMFENQSKVLGSLSQIVEEFPRIKFEDREFSFILGFKMGYSSWKYSNWNTRRQVVKEMQNLLSQINLGELNSVLRKLLSLLVTPISRKRNRLYLHLTGGLGNQMFQVIAAISVSNGREVVIFSEAGMPRLNSEGLPEVFGFDRHNQINRTPALKTKNRIFAKILGFLLRSGINPTGLEKNEKFIKALQGIANIILSVLMRERIRVFVAKDVGMVSEIDPKANLLIGYFQSFLWQHKSQCQDVFKKTDLHNSPIYGNFVQLAEKNTVLAVHIRLGDYIKEDLFGIPNKLYYSRGISQIREKSEISQIWIFTDSPELLDDYFEPVPNVEVILVPNDAISSVETLEIMRLANHYVIANSSFSWWGARLSKSDSSIIIAPRPWFHSMPSPYMITPPEWILLDAWSGEMP